MRTDTAIAIDQCTSRQRGLITRDQSLACGMSWKVLLRLVKSSRWAEVDQFVYRPGGVPEAPGSKLQALILATDGSASHWSAAWVHGLTDREPERHEVAIAAKRSYRGQGKVHRSHFVPEHHRTVVDGLACTTVERTLFDLAAETSVRRLERLFETALRLELTTFERLAACFVELARSGRSGTVRMRTLLEQHDPAAGPTESELETRFVQLMRSTGLPLPDRQRPVDLPLGTVRVDFVYPSLGLVIEVDGRRWHVGRKAFERDPARRNELVAAGGTVLQFTWGHLRYDPDWVRRIVSQTYAALVATRSDRDFGLFSA